MAKINPFNVFDSAPGFADNFGGPNDVRIPIVNGMPWDRANGPSGRWRATTTPSDGYYGDGSTAKPTYDPFTGCLSGNGRYVFKAFGGGKVK